MCQTIQPPPAPETTAKDTPIRYRVRWLTRACLAGSEMYACHVEKTEASGDVVTYRVVMDWHGKTRCNCASARFGKGKPCKHQRFLRPLFERQMAAF